jgi:hypothetical protein
MPIKYYEWGILTGGANADGSPISLPTTGYGVPEMFVGQTNGVGVTTVTFSKPTKHTRIANVHDQFSMQYSFDNVVWFTLIPYQIIQENTLVSEVYLQSFAAGTQVDYEVVAILQG